jgi:hypothetical protein
MEDNGMGTIQLDAETKVGADFKTRTASHYTKGQAK